MSDAPHDIVLALRRFITHRLTRMAVCWLLCLIVAAVRWHHAFHCFDSPRVAEDAPAADLALVREDGNNGHTWIDFGGQYVFGRTAADGHWRELYHRDTLRRTAETAYPTERQSRAVQMYHNKPDLVPPELKDIDLRTDSERLLRSMMGDDHEDRRNAKLSEVVGTAFAGGTDNPFAVVACLDNAQDRTEEDQNSGAPALGRENLGGPLYPPVHSLYYAPLGLIRDSQLAYYLFQLFSVVTVFGSGLAVRSLTRGRVWWSVATTVLFLMPGMRPGIDLGQNHAITLCIVLTGWALASRGKEFGGGMVWGLLAFKPVWGLAFILAPVLLRKWKFVAGTGVAGVTICLATLPLVGVQGWKDWLQVGRSAADLYNVDQNWINLSRDVSGIPKRVLLDFSKPKHEIHDPWVNTISNVLLGVVVLTTVGVGVAGGNIKRLLRGGTIRRMIRVQEWFKGMAGAEYLLRSYGTSYIGLRAGFLLLGGWLCCYRFMYYDSVLIAVGMVALLAYPKWQLAGWRGELREANQPPARRRTFVFVNSFPLTILILLLLTDNVLLYSGNVMTVANEGFAREVTDSGGGTVSKRGEDGTTTSAPKTKWTARQLILRFDYNHPVETFFVLALWGWCGWRLIRHGDRERFPPPDPSST